MGIGRGLCSEAPPTGPISPESASDRRERTSRERLFRSGRGVRGREGGRGVGFTSRFSLFATRTRLLRRHTVVASGECVFLSLGVSFSPRAFVDNAGAQQQHRRYRGNSFDFSVFPFSVSPRQCFGKTSTLSVRAFHFSRFFFLSFSLLLSLSLTLSMDTESSSDSSANSPPSPVRNRTSISTSSSPSPVRPPTIHESRAASDLELMLLQHHRRANVAAGLGQFGQTHPMTNVGPGPPPRQHTIDAILGRRSAAESRKNADAMRSINNNNESSGK